MNNEWKYTKIPKSAFTYWGGRMSYLHFLTLKSFRHLNPDWKITLYRPKFEYKGNRTWSTNEHSIIYKGDDYTEQALKLDINIIEIDLSTIGFKNDVPEVFKSNYLTYHILARDGGVWFDMDILFIKPMSHLDLTKSIILGQNDTLEAVISYHKSEISDKLNYFSTGLLMGAPETEFFKLLSQFVIKSFNPRDYMSATNNLYPKLFKDLQGIRTKFPDLKFANLQMDVVYPYRCVDMELLFFKNNITRITNQTIGIHWYNGHPITKSFLNSQNYDKAATINTIIKKYLSSISQKAQLV